MSAPTSFTTQRLHAERVTSADGPFLTAIFADHRVNATLGGPRDAAGVQAMFDRMTSHWDRHGFGTWILSPRALPGAGGAESGTRGSPPGGDDGSRHAAHPWPERPGAGGVESGRIGWVGLHETEVGGPGGVELLYTIAADHWRRGFAMEAGRVAVEIGHRDLDRDELVCFTMVGNVGSRGVMESLGFVYDQDVEHAGLPHTLLPQESIEWVSTQRRRKTSTDRACASGSSWPGSTNGSRACCSRVRSER